MASWWLKTSYISEATGPIARLCAETCSRLVDMATGPGATGRSSLVQVIMAAEAWRDGAQVLRGYLKSFEINRQETIWNESQTIRSQDCPVFIGLLDWILANLIVVPDSPRQRSGYGLFE